MRTEWRQPWPDIMYLFLSCLFSSAKIDFHGRRIYVCLVHFSYLALRRVPGTQQTLKKCSVGWMNESVGG